MESKLKKIAIGAAIAGAGAALTYLSQYVSGQILDCGRLY